MRKFLTGCLVLSFLWSLFPTPILAQEPSEEQAKKLEAAGKKIQSLLEAYQKKELDKYNEIDITIKDTDGNPRDCRVQLYYNDFKQERFSTENGYFNSVFNHGDTIPTELFSVAVYECPCTPASLQIIGPTYPGLTEEIEKIKEVLLDDLESQATEKLTEEGKELLEKSMEKVFDAMGHEGAAWAGRFMSGVSIGMDLGQPFKQFFDHHIEIVFDAFLMQDSRRNRILGEKTPKQSQRSIIKEEWRDYGARQVSGSTWHSPTTKYDLDLTLQCYKNYRPPEFHLDWKVVDQLKKAHKIDAQPITEPQPKPETEPTETPAEAEARRQAEYERIEAMKREWEANRQAREAEAKAQAEAEAKAQARAEAIATQCKKCEDIKEALTAKRGELDRAQQDSHLADVAVRQQEVAVHEAQQNVEKAQKALDQFLSPDVEYIESEGDRIDATDLALREAAAQAAWQQYLAGEISAQAVESYWKSLDKAGIEKLRQETQSALEAAVAKAKTQHETQQKELTTTQEAATAAQAKTQALAAEVEKLENAYKACLKKCQEGEKIDLALDFGITLEHQKVSFAWLPWKWNEAVHTNVTLDPALINTIPDYSGIDLEGIVSPTHEADAKEGQSALYDTKSSLPFHSVLDEIDTGSLLINAHTLGQGSTLINIAAPRPLNRSIPADATQSGPGTELSPKFGNESGEYQLAMAMQVLFTDSKSAEGKPVPAPPHFTLHTPDADDTVPLDDLPEVTKISPGRTEGRVNPGTSFVLTFSEPMDQSSVEDNFIIRAFTDETLDLEDPEVGTSNLNQAYIWDDTQFDINWNSEATEAAFTFADEHSLPTDKDTQNTPDYVLVFNEVDQYLKNKSDITTDEEYFTLTDGALDDYFKFTIQTINDQPSVANFTPDGPPVLVFETGKIPTKIVVVGNVMLQNGQVIGVVAPSDNQPPVIFSDPSKPFTQFDPSLPGPPGQPIFTDGFESGAPDAWGEGEPVDQEPPIEIFLPGNPGPESFISGENDILVELPPANPSCRGDQYTSNTCGNGCGNDFRCQAQNKLSNGTQCYGCEFRCESGQFTNNTCSNTCAQDIERCVPSGVGNSCFECITIPKDIIGSVPQEESLITTPIEPIDTCTPRCDGLQCGDDGCGGSCGECALGDECNAEQYCTPVDKCPLNSFEKTSCSSCEYGCEPTNELGSSSCYTCKTPPVDLCTPQCNGKQCGDDGCGGSCGLCDLGMRCNNSSQCESDAPVCPMGSITDINACNAQCSNGACNDNGGGCYSCLQCDSGSWSTESECQANSDSTTCEIGGSQGNLSCWVPVASCADICSQNGFSAEPIDFTSSVESQLNAQNCVSSYSMTIQQITAGDCQCYDTNTPSLIFDTTPPICSGTVCGDVVCGQSTSCAVDEGTANVSCQWQGWKKQDLYDYIPLLGGQ